METKRETDSAEPWLHNEEWLFDESTATVLEPELGLMEKLMAVFHLETTHDFLSFEAQDPISLLETQFKTVMTKIEYIHHSNILNPSGFWLHNMHTNRHFR